MNSNSNKTTSTSGGQSQLLAHQAGNILSSSSSSSSSPNSSAAHLLLVSAQQSKSRNNGLLATRRQQQQQTYTETVVLRSPATLSLSSSAPELQTTMSLNSRQKREHEEQPIHLVHSNANQFNSTHTTTSSDYNETLGNLLLSNQSNDHQQQSLAEVATTNSINVAEATTAITDAHHYSREQQCALGTSSQFSQLYNCSTINTTTTSNSHQEFSKDFFLQHNFSEIEEVWIRKSWLEILFRFAFVAPIVLLGIFGNLTIIYSMFKFKPFRSKPTNIFILNMAIADLFTSLVCPIAALHSYIYQFYTLGAFICHLEGFVKITCLLVSSYSLIVLSFDWLLCVVKPCRTRISIRQSWLALGTIWSASILMATPLFIWREHRERQWKDILEVWCCEDFTNYTRYYWPVMTFVLIYLPTFFMTVVLIIILAQMDKYEAKLKRSCSTQNQRTGCSLSINMKYRRRIVKILFTYLLTSIICWTPLQFTIIYRNFRSETVLPDWFNEVNFFAQLSASLTAAMNPIIFGFLSQPFRRIVSKILKFKFLDKIMTTNGKNSEANNNPNNHNNNDNHQHHHHPMNDSNISLNVINNNNNTPKSNCQKHLRSTQKAPGVSAGNLNHNKNQVQRTGSRQSRFHDQHPNAKEQLNRHHQVAAAAAAARRKGSSTTATTTTTMTTAPTTATKANFVAQGRVSKSNSQFVARASSFKQPGEADNNCGNGNITNKRVSFDTPAGLGRPTLKPFKKQDATGRTNTAFVDDVCSRPDFVPGRPTNNDNNNLSTRQLSAGRSSANMGPPKATTSFLSARELVGEPVSPISFVSMDSINIEENLGDVSATGVNNKIDDEESQEDDEDINEV